MFIDILRASLIAALPIFIIAYLLISRAILSKRLDKFTDNKSLDGAMKEMKMRHRQDKSGFSVSKTPSQHLIDKWLYFGGGFYGLMAVTTFFYIEVGQIIGFFGKLFSLSLSELFSLISINLLVDLLVDAILNLVDAFVWFQYWTTEIEMHNGWVWLVASYLAYLGGARLAKHYPVNYSFAQCFNLLLGRKR